MTPDVSVIIPYHRHGRYLTAAIQSALAATSRPLEVLIVDDGADEPGAARHLSSAVRQASEVRILRQTNAGVAAARNAGLDAARGRYVQFLDADDLLYPGKIDRQIDHLEARPELVASVCRYAVGDPDGAGLDHAHDTLSRFPLTAASFLYRWERGFSVPIHTPLLRRSTLADHRFDTRLRAQEDWVFWLGLLRRHPTGMGGLSILGAVYRTHPDGVTRDRAVMGAAFAHSAAALAEVWSTDHPHFLAASEAWRSRFYGAEGVSAAPSAPPPLAPHSAARLQRANVARRRRLEDYPSDPRPPRILDHLNAGALSGLLAEFRLGRRLAFETDGRDLSVAEIDLLRRYNGLFERIRVEADAAVSLMGYLWGVEALTAHTPYPGP